MAKTLTGKVSLVTGGSRGLGAAIVLRLARDLAPRGITINNVHPGPVDTDMNPATSDFAKILLDKVMALPRYASGDEIASLVAYLAGPEAAFVTGASLTIDGGFTA
jgi:3-oxoacyl-[acyl-carrier protein] reductase